MAAKTSELHEKGERLQALYDMSTLIANATTLEELGNGFSRRIAGVARADAVALRWSDERNERYVLLASHGLPKSMADEEQCLMVGDCLCGVPTGRRRRARHPDPVAAAGQPEALRACRL